MHVHLYFAENCAIYATDTFFSLMPIQGDQSCMDFECLRFIQLQEENLVSQVVSGKLPQI